MSKLIAALQEGMSLRKGNLPKVDYRVLPPICSISDLHEIGQLIRGFNGGDEFVEVYTGASTSAYYYDGAEEIPELRPNPATQIRVVCNALPGFFIRRFSPGYLRSTQLAIMKNTPIPEFKAGQLYPLSSDGFFFGVLLVADERYNPSRPKPQFGIVMDVQMYPAIGVEEVPVMFNRAILGR